MDSVHQGPKNIPVSIQQGRTLSNKQLARLEHHAKAADLQQLCLFNPAENSHIATGVTRTDLRNLQDASNDLADGEAPILDLLAPKAKNILIASGIKYRNFTPQQQIHLARLLGEGIVANNWAQAIQQALENGNLTPHLVDNLIQAKLQGWEMILEVVQTAVGNNGDLSAFNANEIHQLAGLLLHEQSPIAGDWIQQHAEALTAGRITHPDFQEILTETKQSVDLAALEIAEKKLKDIAPKAEDKKEVDDTAPLHKIALEFAYKQQVSGFQSMSASWHTYTASHIAQQVIREDGKVDDKAIAKLREEIQSDLFQQVGPKDPHGAHVLAMLDALENNNQGIRNITESIGAPKDPLTSKSSQKIRSTLDLPPSTKITSTHARKAALSTLFSSMRQHSSVGSCFATAIAIRVHDDDPARLLREIKSLIENDYLEAKGPFADIQLPIATTVNVESVRKNLSINLVEEGKGRPYAVITELSGFPTGETLPIEEIPGVAAALNTLGIPEENHRDLILEALQDTGVDQTSLEAILKQVIINQRQEGKEANKQLARAVDAFEAQESNTLLRAWEYTLAGLSGAETTGVMVVMLKNAITNAQISESSNTLMEKLDAVFERQMQGLGLGVSTRKVYNSILQDRFQNEIEKNIHARFHASLSAQINTTQSGWELYYANDDEQEVSIKTDGDFKAFLLQAFTAACERMKEELSSEDETPTQNAVGEKLSTAELTAQLEEILNEDGILTSIIDNFNQEDRPGVKTTIHREPSWFIETGGLPQEVLKGYYSIPIIDVDTISLTDSIKDLGNSFPLKLISNLKKDLRKNSMDSSPNNMTTGVNGHVLNIRTNADPTMQALMESYAPEDTLNELFFAPGEELREKNLSEPEIKAVVSHIFKMMGDESLADEYLPQIMESLKESSKPADLCNACLEQFDSTPEIQQTIQSLIVQALSPPTISFADTNYIDLNGNGYIYVSCLYNPISGDVELWNTAFNGIEFTPISPSDENYQSTHWLSYTHPNFYPEVQEAS